MKNLKPYMNIMSFQEGFEGQPLAMKEPSNFRRRLLRSILIPLSLYLTKICCAVCASSAKADSTMPAAITTTTTTNKVDPNNKNGEEVVAVVQLFLVRHGETEGNKLGLTLGQSDSVS
jgi:Na+-transporting methylmalonyl-CoA/oxaloacetate decarboxylase gamma subunit